MPEIFFVDDVTILPGYCTPFFFTHSYCVPLSNTCTFFRHDTQRKIIFSRFLSLSHHLISYFVFVDVTVAEESRRTSFRILGWDTIKTSTNRNKPVFTK